MRTYKRSIIVSVLAISALVPSLRLLYAGGFLFIARDGIVYKWDPSQPVKYNPDRGSLGILGTSQAVKLIDDNIKQWDNSHIPTSSLSFTNAGLLASDVVTVEDFNALGGESDGISPIIFDADGSLFEDLGFDSGTLGFASPDIIRTISPFYIIEGIAVFNGSSISTPDDAVDFAGVVAHEFGHMLNLDHTQVNGHFFIGDTNDPGFSQYGEPTRASVSLMFPFVLSGQPIVPISDDIRTISTLYPAGGFPGNFGTIEGNVFESNGVSPFNGANIIVRNSADPFFDVASNVSGALFFSIRSGTTNGPAFDGFYQVNGLTPGASYTVEMVRINSQFDAGSRVGPIDPPAIIPGPEEFWNDTNETGDETDAPLDFVLVTPNSTVSDIDFLINKQPVTFELNNFREPAEAVASVQSLISSGSTPNGPNDYAAVRFSIPASLDTPFTVIRFNFFNNDNSTVWPRMILTTPNEADQPDLLNPLSERNNVRGQDNSFLVRVLNLAHRGFEDLFVVVQFPPGETLTGQGAGGGAGIGGDAQFESGFQDYFKGNLYSTDGVNFAETISTAGMGEVDAINWKMNIVIPENQKPDEFEPNDVAQDATPINFGETKKAYIDPFGELDTYSFTGSAGDTIQAGVYATAIGSELDGFLMLVNAAGDTVALHDDRVSGVAQDPLLQAVLPAIGDYFLIMDSFDNAFNNTPVGGVDFFYELRLDTFSPLFEPNNSTAQAIQIDTSQSIAAALDLPADIDFYRFTIPGEEFLTAQLMVGGSSIDPVLTLFDTDGTTVLAIEEGRSLQLRLTTAGTYFLAVADIMDIGGADLFYELNISFGTANLGPPTDLVAAGFKDQVRLNWNAPVASGGPRTLEEAEPNNGSSAAQDLSGSFPVVVTGNAEVSDVGGLVINFNDGTSDDLEDMYRITTESKGLVITLTGLEADLDLYLINQSATTIIDASGNSGTADEKVDQPELAPGTYLLGVTIFDQDPGKNTSPYTLTLTNDSAPTAPILQSFNVYRSETEGARNNGALVGTVVNTTVAAKNQIRTSGAFTFIDSLLDAKTFFYQVTAVYDQGESAPSIEASAVVTSIDDLDPELPRDYGLSQNYPNPFNPSTVIRYALPALHAHQNVKLDIYNMLGQKVRTLVNEDQPVGFHTVEWDGLNDSGKPVTSGLYIYRIKAGSFTEVKKMLFIK
ncbi:MAG: pre-peptidase C-terminal domain-containing protein [bacterium]